MTTHTNPSFSRYLRTFGQLGPVVPEIDLKDALEARRAWKEARKKKYARHIHIFFLNVFVLKIMKNVTLIKTPLSDASKLS
jgi:hypothetical protein